MSIDEALRKRLQWRVRRGTAELDTMLGWWLTERFDGAAPEQREAFAQLLDAQDPDLWDWLLGHARVPRADWQEVIDDIRAAHRL